MPRLTFAAILAAGVLFIMLMGSAHAQSAGFAFGGFTLGMTRADATKIRPDLTWRAVPYGDETRTSLDVTGEHLGQSASVLVQLDAKDEYVRAIGFTFLTPTDTRCIQQAVEALSQLKASYGIPSEIAEPPFGWKWTTKDKVVVRWIEACAIGAQRYFVTYVRDRG